MAKPDPERVFRATSRIAALARRPGRFVWLSDACTDITPIDAEIRELTAVAVAHTAYPIERGLSEDIARIVRVVASELQVTQGELLGSSRDKRLAFGRQAAMWLARTYYSGTQPSYPSLARAFDRDHTTVMHAIEKIDDILTDRASSEARFIRELQERLGFDRATPLAAAE